ncbi:hypothetical protein FN846DRAFT_926353 [Sphaerosporella brunnea]|uniref:Peptidase A1 domain-containing protein n=1 Tax=Sphaerosporella brunnea TaxID=1250544 RepID=A0A5J5FB56_9PEZI|nr:hypothetical protein FN846DRAFT_926353 [Sphaerosporella brunnea]
MLWSDLPPRRSISGYFTMRKTVGDGKDAVASTTPVTNIERQKSCLTFLASNGGYYNQSLDPAFQRSDFFTASFTDAYTGWAVANTGEGSTTLSFEAQGESGPTSKVYFNQTSMDLISSSTLGTGMLSLGMLQAARNVAVIEMNVMALNLGTEEQTGSVVLGGYDEALIDPTQRAVFPKAAELPRAFHAYMTKVVFDGGSQKVLLNEDPGLAADVDLRYDDYGLRLSQELIDTLLPLIGNPTYDEDVKGYVYNGEPKLDYSLTFGLSNGTSEVMIKVPASSLIMTQSPHDNPLTPLNETGKTFLQIRPTTNGTSDQYLGRSFMRHVYIIDSPSTLEKFHLSAVRQSSGKKLIAASKSSISIFDGDYSIPSSDGYRLGPIIGGIVGGIGFLIAAAIGCFWFIRRRNRHNGSISGHRSINITGNDSTTFHKETGLGHIVHHHRGKGMNGGGLHTEHSDSFRTTATIPIRYSPSFEKEIGIAYRHSPQSQPNTLPRAVQSRPIMLFETPSSSSRSSSLDHELEIPQLRDSRLSVTLSAIQRRNSEVSTVAREYNTGSSEPEPEPRGPAVPGEPIPRLYRSATVGRMYKAGKVRSVEGLSSPHSPGSRHGSRSPTTATRGHSRTASLGRVVTPTEVDVCADSHKSITRRSSGSTGDRSRGGEASGSGSSGHTGSLEELREAPELEPRPQSAISSDMPENHLRRLTIQTRSSGALLSPRDTLGLPSSPYAESSGHSDSRASTPHLAESIRSEVGLESPPHSRSGFLDTGDMVLRERSSEDEVFGLGAVRGEYLPPKEGWLSSESEGSTEKEVRQEQFLNHRGEGSGC